MEGVTITVENGKIVIRMSSDRAEDLSSALIDAVPVTREADDLARYLTDKLADTQMALLTQEEL